VYESGRRSGAWVKFEITKSQELVIGGYTLPERGRKYFGSLLVGYNSLQGFVFAGRVGTGFFGQGPGESLCKVSNTENSVLSVCKSAGEIKRQMGPRDYTGGHETVPVA
jgi:ATP-dependent DNA ligase